MWSIYDKGVIWEGAVTLMNSAMSLGYLSEKNLDFYCIADIRNNSKKSMDLKLLKKKYATISS